MSLLKYFARLLLAEELKPKFFETPNPKIRLVKENESYRLEWNGK